MKIVIYYSSTCRTKSVWLSFSVELKIILNIARVQRALDPIDFNCMDQNTETVSLWRRKEYQINFGGNSDAHFFHLMNGSLISSWLDQQKSITLNEIALVSRSQTFRLTAEGLGTLAVLKGQGPSKRLYDWQVKKMLMFSFVPCHV